MRVTSLILFVGLALHTPAPVLSYEWCQWWDAACHARNVAKGANQVGQVISGVSNTVSDVTNAVTDGVTGTISFFCPICAGVAGEVGDSIKGVTKHVTNSVSNVGSSVTNAVGDVSHCVVRWDVNCAIGAVTESVVESTNHITGSVLGSIGQVTGDVLASISDVSGKVVAANTYTYGQWVSNLNGEPSEVAAAYAKEALEVAKGMANQLVANIAGDDISFGGKVQYYSGSGCSNTNFDGQSMAPISAGVCERAYNLPAVVSGGYPIWIAVGKHGADVGGCGGITQAECFRRLASAVAGQGTDGCGTHPDNPVDGCWNSPDGSYSVKVVPDSNYFQSAEFKQEETEINSSFERNKAKIEEMAKNDATCHKIVGDTCTSTHTDSGISSGAEHHESMCRESGQPDGNFDNDCCGPSEKTKAIGATPTWCDDGYVKVETEPCGQDNDWCQNGNCMHYQCLKPPEDENCMAEKCAFDLSACQKEGACGMLLSDVLETSAVSGRPPTRAEVESKNNKKYSDLFTCYQQQCIGEPFQCLVRQQGCLVEFNCPHGRFTGTMQGMNVNMIGEATGITGKWRTDFNSEAIDFSLGHTCAMIPSDKTTFAPQTLPADFESIVTYRRLSGDVIRNLISSVVKLAGINEADSKALTDAVAGLTDDALNEFISGDTPDMSALLEDSTVKSALETAGVDVALLASSIEAAAAGVIDNGATGAAACVVLSAAAATFAMLF